MFNLGRTECFEQEVELLCHIVILLDTVKSQLPHALVKQMFR